MRAQNLFKRGEQSLVILAWLQIANGEYEGRWNTELIFHQGLRYFTLHGAEAIGLDADVGSLEAGKLADILVLDRNPLDEIESE